MSPFQTLDDDSLLDSLTAYYTRYREIIETNWNQDDYNTCRDTLLEIINELNKRQGLHAELNLPERDYNFDRKAT